jgi:Mrp family chromosome partitioning ATPase
MSALDQALTKAYAKNRAGAAPTADHPPAKTRVQAVPCTGGQAIERVYREGALYRVETRATVAAVPAPHSPTLPPTSPRRGVRRSLLRLLASSQSITAPEPTAHSKPRVARKVIIRHISHGAAPAPIGIVASKPQTTEALIADALNLEPSRAELPLESIVEQPAPFSAPPLPVTPPVPQRQPDTAPFNVAVEPASIVEMVGRWDLHEAIAPLVVVAEARTAALVAVQLDALDAAEEAAAELPAPEQETVEEEPTSMADAAPPVEDRQPRLEIRIDAPHAKNERRPHVVFHPPVSSAPPPVVQEPEPQFAASPEIEPTPRIAAELTLAETADEPLASDLISHETDAPLVAAPETPNDSAAPARPALPLWEVDRFHWPRVCEKLLADEYGYLARAGERLLAAVQDGLKVLAITGSRRGEGRTTLALSLARAAVKAGVQAAVMDADFARPQLATKIALDVAYGWQDAALGRIPLSEAAIKSLADNLTVLPLESSAATRSLSLADPRVTATIRAASATFELLILDLGPHAAGETIGFPTGEACPLDAAIVIRDLRFATQADSEAIGQMLLTAGVEAVGIAENFVTDDELALS